MNPLIIGAAGLAVFLLTRKKKDNEDNKDNSGETTPVRKRGILWAHKTEAAWVAAGFTDDIIYAATSGGQYQINDLTVIHPGFIDPSKGMDYFMSGSGDEGHYSYPTVYVSKLELEEIANPNGVYQILRPLIKGGIFESDKYLELMMSPDGIAHLKSQPQWQDILDNKTNFAKGRTYPFRMSKIYRVRTYDPIFSAYTYPISLEIEV
jgi:hypothetical protein